MKDSNLIINTLSQKLLVIFNKLFKGKYVYLLWLLLPILLSFAARVLSGYFGDSDGLITGDGKYAIHDTLFLLLYLIPIAIYYKIKHFAITGFSNFYFLIFPMAFFIRIYLASLGGNSDLESYNIVSDIVLEGNSVYANTMRYNYAPMWAYILAGCKLIALHFNDSGKVFHYLIVCVLFSAESYIGWQLYKKYRDAFIMILFLFNPIGIVITGYHSQFDILAVAVAFAAALQINKNHIFKAAFLLGLSLMIKHLMIFYAFFLLFDKNLTVRNKVIITLLPVSIFLVSFIPFWQDFDAIKQNVFGYKHGFNAGIYPQLLKMIFPEQVVKTAIFNWLPVFKGWMFLWLLTMLGMGYLVNKNCKQYAFEMYLLILVFTSITFSEQYLYIPVLAIAVFYKYYASWVYTFLGGFFLVFASRHNLGPQNWIKFFSVDIDPEQLYFSYPVIQIWLFVLLLMLFRNYDPGQDKLSAGN